MSKAIANEIKIRAKNWNYRNIETIYFGGGTPSVLEKAELDTIMNAINTCFDCSNLTEVTIECNPEDLTNLKVQEWLSLGINRLSIGIQSLSNEELQWMHRSHTAEQSKLCVEVAQESGMKDISIDLIYGGPYKSKRQWEAELEWFSKLNVGHLSAYGLTAEPKTLYQHQIDKDEKLAVNTEKQVEQYKLLYQLAEHKNWNFYEISNLSKTAQKAVHNSNYWQRKPYLGIGPGAHGYADNSRYWNVSNNALYIKQLKSCLLAEEKEELTEIDIFNEIVMVNLRLKSGLDLNTLDYVNKEHEHDHAELIEIYKKKGYLHIENSKAILTLEGRLFADAISSGLMYG